MEKPEFIQRFWWVVDEITFYGNNPHKVTVTKHRDGKATLAYRYFLIQELFDMAQKKRKPSQYNQRSVSFINYRFDASTRKKFDEYWKTAGDKVASDIYDTLQDDVKLSLSHDLEGKTFIATLIGREDSLNAGKCLVIRSADWLKAIAAVSWVHTIIFSSEIWDEDENSNEI